MHRPGIHINSLPQEVIVKIFTYLAQSELCDNVPLVCRRWRNLAGDSDVWLSVSINPDKSVTSDDLSRLLHERATRIKQLDISGRQLSLADVERWAPHSKTLRDLDMSGCTFAPGQMLSIFQTLVRNCTQIEKLNVGQSSIDHESVVALTGFCHLKEISFWGCNQVQNKSVKALNDHFSGLKVFVYHAEPSDITEETMLSLIKKQQNSLTELYIDVHPSSNGGPWTDETVRAIGTCSHLKILSLSPCDKLTDASLSVIKSMASLTELVLQSGTNFSSRGLSSFFKDNRMKKLVPLSLNMLPKLGDKVVTDLLACFGNNLQSLNLSGCKHLTDISIDKIVASCSRMLVLLLTRLPKITGHWLSRIPESMPRLEYVDVRYCRNINHQAVKDLKNLRNWMVIVGNCDEDDEDTDATVDDDDIDDGNGDGGNDA